MNREAKGSRVLPAFLSALLAVTLSFPTSAWGDEDGDSAGNAEGSVSSTGENDTSLLADETVDTIGSNSANGENGLETYEAMTGGREYSASAEAIDQTAPGAGIVLQKNASTAEVLMQGTVYEGTAVSSWGDAVTSQPEGYVQDDEAKTVVVSTAEGLAWLSSVVNGTHDQAASDLAGYTVTLAESIDLAGKTWTPIGTMDRPFSGTFDGNGKAIGNLSINDSSLRYAGLFGIFKTPAVVKNVTINNASITALAEIGALAGSAYTGTVENCKVTGTIDLQGNYKVGGLVGEGYAKIIGCSVVGNSGSTIKGVWSSGNNLEGDNIGGLLGFTGEGASADRISSCTVSGVSVSGTRKVGGMLGYLSYGVRIDNCVVDSVTVTCDLTGNASYLDSNKDSSGIGGLVGVVHGKPADVETDAGAMTDCVVSNTTLVTEDTPAMAGYLYGKLRIAPDHPVTTGSFAVDCTGSTVASDATGHAGSDGAGAGASIGEKSYATLQSAVDAANSGDTVTLLADATVSETIAIDKSLTINLNGKTLSNEVSGGRAFDIAAPTVEFTIDGTVTGSTVDIPASNTGALGLINIAESGTGSTVTLTGGAYTGDTASGGRLLVSTANDLNMTFTLNLNTVTATSNKFFAYSDIKDAGGSFAINVTGGSFTTTNGSAFACAGANDKSTISFKDTTVKTNNGYGIQIFGPTSTFEGCTFETTGSSMESSPTTTVAAASNAVVAIVGGSYTSNHYGMYVYSSGGTLNIQDGAVSGETAAIKADENSTAYPGATSVVNVSGGTFTGDLMPDGNSELSITGGAFDSEVAAYFDGDIYSQNAQTASENPGAVVPRVFGITYDLASGALAEGASNPATYTYFDDAFTLQNPVRAGYTFAGWTGTGLTGAVQDATVPTHSKGDRSYTATWTPSADVSYTVHYYLDGMTTKLAADKLVENCTFMQTYIEQAPAIEGYTVSGAVSQDVVLDAYGKEIAFSYTANEARIVFESNGGTKAADIVGRTGARVAGSLPQVTRDGYAFAGWYADRALTKAVAQLPATFPAGTATYWAKWNAVPLPDAPDIQVEVPQAPGDGSPHATVPDATVTAAAESAQSAIEAIKQGQAPSGMAPQDADAIAQQLAGVEDTDEVSVVVSLGAEVKGADAVDQGEKSAIEGVAEGNEEVSLFLDLSVTMSVVVKNDDGVEKSRKEAALAVVDEPLLFEVHVDPALIQNKTVRIAYVHDGATTVLVPESIDRENGIIRFYASEFSTYALLTSETCTVTFETNGGTAVKAQEVAFSTAASRPADPTRDGFAFAGWFADAACTQAYDFAQPVEASLTLYAKWAEAAGRGNPPSGTDEPAAKSNGGGQDSGKGKRSMLLATGDGMGALALPLAGGAGCAAVLLACCAFLALRRRSR